jgi:hypothetical protein
MWTALINFALNIKKYTMTANSLKKFFAILLSLLVLIITTLSILAIWDVIEVKDIFGRAFSSLFIIFVASAIILFIFTVLYPVTLKKEIPNLPTTTPQNQ